MKVLEAQNAVLTNFEVYHYLTAQRKKQGPGPKRRRPGNLETLVRELLNFLTTYPGPLSQKPLTYDAGAVARLVERLRPYGLSKGEMIMALNLRPTTPAALSAIIEEMESRLDEDQRAAVVDVIVDVLGQFPPREEQPMQLGDDGDDDDAAAAAAPAAGDEGAVQPVETGTS